ncbi:MAG: two-component sensor histidine kinase [Rheinheimera sp.]|uniref:sensor histidine kinase n=1 Tax=Arsukibacterium sp. UBA3155 TaxID=1946058 RepID=UPI000C980955|nr:ATP-binding protein [Arsukibacterium sp. UBA3155]MAD73664.1 two-component sensor histidine kinase [Rheinheimera sp.]|tara:strand:- start:230473 stop:231873 length:1401 start_codon:yes stop_codon:yes gene_type:complete
MAINSIKVYLLIGINLLMLGALSVNAYLTYSDALHELNEIYDAELARSAKLISLLLSSSPLPNTDNQPVVVAVPHITDMGESLTAQQERLLDGHKYEGKIAFQAQRGDKLIMLSENALQFPTPKREAGYHEITEHGVLWVTFSYFVPAEDLWIFTAQREDIRQEMGAHIAQAQVRPILFMMLPLSLLIYLVIKLGLRPLQLLQQQVANKTPEQLHEIKLALPSELQPIQSAINSLLQRIYSYLQQEKRFIADASHELRTPLSILQLHAQNLSSASDPAEVTEAVNAITEGSKRMSHLVNQLLSIARLDHLQHLDCTAIAVTPLLHHSLSQLPAKLLDKVTWQLELDDSCQIYGDNTLLQSVLRNVLDNAAKYSPADGTVVILSRQDSHQHILIKISNSGNTEADPSRLGNRFYRHQQHQQTEGAGLGLSIVKHIVELHKGSLEFKVNMIGGLDVFITLSGIPNRPD